MPAFAFEAWPKEGRATFTPLDIADEPAGEPRTYQVHSIEYEYIEPLPRFTDPLRTIPAALGPVTVAFRQLEASFAELYELITGIRWRPTKADRREAKRRKLGQRRAARARPHVPGRAWHEDMQLYRWPVAAVARGTKARPHPRTNYVHIIKGDKNEQR